ncbi:MULTISPECIES: 4Fe-4S binding protein [unclassified Campylobacter]|uniref:4Fe-4S binding protein n=1 Tax=unclassified Campylobacter TaxID=2593542 RepID=UPI003D33020E
MQDVSRRQLFRKILGGKSAQNFIPPPYFSGEFECVECEAPCVGACDENLLSFDGEKVSFKFQTKGCTFCKKCAIECESTQQSVLNLKFPAIIEAKTIIDISSCLAWNGTMCYSCQDVCKFRAVEFFGVFRPTINNRCTNCAQCMEVCFVNAIKMEAR